MSKKSKAPGRISLAMMKRTIEERVAQLGTEYEQVVAQKGKNSFAARGKLSQFEKAKALALRLKNDEFPSTHEVAGYFGAGARLSLTNSEYYTLLEKLNSYAIQLQDEEGMEPTRALECAAYRYDLVWVANSPLEDPWENESVFWLYQVRGGVDLINCWRSGARYDTVCSGGLGFDQQVEWYFEG